jgi:acyl-CoA synthetase (AMP-forming)/AMP-acid ligase II
MPAPEEPGVETVDDFQSSISAPTPFNSLSDIIWPQGGASAASSRLWAYADEENTRGRAPLTFAALHDFVASFDLRRFGISRDLVVCTALPNGTEAAVCFWAVSKQCVFAPLNPALTLAEIEFELGDLPCHTMIIMDTPAQKAYNERIVSSCASFNVQVLRLVPDKSMVGLFTLEGGDGAAAAPADQPSASHLGLVLHTSGTTKKPKIVPLTHHNMANGIQFVHQTLRRKGDDLCLNVMPLFHIHGLIANIGVSAYSGTRVVCSSFQGGVPFVDQLKRPALRPTWYSAVPTMHEAILLEGEKRGKELDHSLTLMRNCSAALLPPVSKRFIKAFGDDLRQPFTVVPTYAMTESFPICSNPPHLKIKLSTVGPAMGPKIRILAGHPTDEELPQGKEGEVCVVGECVTAGYLIREHMSADPNIEAYSLPDSSIGRMLRTGDKGYIDEDGYLQLVGRFKEIINCGGEKISPLEMEDQLLSVPGVQTCVCFACPAELLGEVVGVAVVPKAGVETPPTLKELRKNLPSFNDRFKPQVLVLMDSIPKGPTGKPKRIGLAQMLRIPAVDMNKDATYKVEGNAVPGTTTGEGLGQLLEVKDDGSTASTWVFPLTITLDMNPDMGSGYGNSGFQITRHELVIRDSLCNEFSLEISTCTMGILLPVKWPIDKKAARQALEYIRWRTDKHGLDWKAGKGWKVEDFCATLYVRDGVNELRHHWDPGMHDTPPGLLLRVLGVLDCGVGFERDPLDLPAVEGRDKIHVNPEDCDFSEDFLREYRESRTRRNEA